MSGKSKYARCYLAEAVAQSGGRETPGGVTGSLVCHAALWRLPFICGAQPIPLMQRFCSRILARQKLKLNGEEETVANGHDCLLNKRTNYKLTNAESH
jgi:hypothetical protein